MNAICGVWPKTTLAITTKIVHMMGWIRTRPPSDLRKAGRLASTCTRRLDWAVSTIGITGQELHDDAHEILATYTATGSRQSRRARERSTDAAATIGGGLEQNRVGGRVPRS